MIETNFLTLLTVIFFAGILAYRMSLFHEKQIGYFSLLQVVYLVLIPGLIFPLAFSYMRSIVARPQNPDIVFADGFLTNLILISILFSYGGIAVHSVTKMIEEAFDPNSVEERALKIVRFFHFTFSHNLIYSGAALVVLGFTLLDLNHQPMVTDMGLVGLVVKGIALGAGLFFSIYYYQPYATSRWTDLRTFFLMIWVAFMTVLYSIRKVDPGLTDYQLLLPALLSFALISFLSVVLVLRRVKRGEWRLKLRLDRILPG